MSDVQITVSNEGDAQVISASLQETQITSSVPGIQGPVGQGFPSGGTTNQVLFKQSNTSYDAVWGFVTSSMIGDLEIVNTDVAANAAIAGTKISPNFGSQNVITTGTNTAASFIPTSSTVPTNGVYLPSANSVAISTGGAGRLFVNATGEILAGTSTSVDGNWKIQANAAAGALTGIGVNNNGGYGVYLIYDNSTRYSGAGVLRNIANSPLAFETNNTERLRITSAGLVGIGTSSVASKLTVAGTQGNFRVDPDSVTNEVQLLTTVPDNSGFRNYRIRSNQIFLDTSGSTAVTIDTSQRVGIGTTSPQHLLDCASIGRFTGNTNSAASGAGIEIGYDAGNTTGFIQSYNRGSSTYLSTAVDGSDVRFKTSGSERARIDSSGRLGIGTSSPSYNLQVAETSAVVSAASYSTFFGQGTRADLVLRATSSNNDQQRQVIRSKSDSLIFGTENSAVTTFTEKLRIDSSGNVGIGTSSPTSLLHVDSAPAGTQSARTLLSSSNSADTVACEIRQGRFNKDVLVVSSNQSLSANLFNAIENGTSRFVITGAGNVGIGTTNPISPLVVSNGGAAGIEIRPALSDIISFNRVAGTWGNLILNSANNIFQIQGGEVGRFDNSGRLLVGTSTALTGATAQYSKNVNLGNSANASGNAVLAIGRGAAATSISSGNQIGSIYFTDNGAGEFASIDCFADAAPGTNDFPGRLVFSTTADGASSPTERLRITSAGLVGIGTSSPGFPFQVKSTTNAHVAIWDNGGIPQVIGVNDAGGSAQLRLAGQILSFTGNGGAGSEHMRLDPSGQLGIGTTSASALLTLRSTASNNTAGISMQGASSGNITNLYNTFTDYVVEHAGSEAFRVDASRRLLVGTSTARANFYNSTGTPQVQVESTGSDGSSLSLTTNFTTATPTASPNLSLARSGATSLGSNTLVAADNALGNINFLGADGSEFVTAAQIQGFVDGTPGANDMPGRLVFSTTADGASSPTERMRIRNNGSTGIFHTASGAGGAVLELNSSATAGTTDYLFWATNSATGTFTGTVCLRAFTNGDVQNTNNSYGAISDAKLKENIVDATSQWSDIKALQVRKYNFKEGQTHTQIGLIAQEVEQVSPGLVSESPDRDAEGNDLGTVTKSVNYSVLYMKAVKALQEAMERIETLEQRLNDAGIN